MRAGSLTPAVKRKHGIRKSVGGFERHRMAAFDHPMLVAVGEHVGMMGCAAGFQRIMSAIQRYGGHTDFRHFRQALLKMLQLRGALFQSKVEAVAVDDDIDKVRIIE